MKNKILVDDLSVIHNSVKERGDWRGATIVITGCSGFLGYYFMNYFSKYGSSLGIKRVVGLDNFILGEPAWMCSLARSYPNLLHIQKFDVAKDSLENLDYINDARYVIHGASIASPTFYRKYPIATIDANIWGLRHFLDFFRDRQALKGFLFFSSSEIYGDPNAEAVPTDEEYRGNVSCHGPRSCYDESKRFGETLCWIYSQQFQMPITVARPFNNYGPGMKLSDKRLPADFANCVIKGEDLTIHSSGRPTRTFCYVSDAIIGYILCLTHGKYDYFNIGIDRPEISVSEFANIFKVSGAKIFGYSGSIKYKDSLDPDYMTDNPNRRCPVIKKAEVKLGYSPKILVTEGIERYLSFLKQELENT